MDKLLEYLRDYRDLLSDEVREAKTFTIQISRLDYRDWDKAKAALSLPNYVLKTQWERYGLQVNNRYALGDDCFATDELVHQYMQDWSRGVKLSLLHEEIVKAAYAVGLVDKGNFTVRQGYQPHVVGRAVVEVRGWTFEVRGGDYYGDPYYVLDGSGQMQARLVGSSNYWTNIGY